MAINIDSHMQQSIQDKIISLRHQISGKKLDQFKAGKIRLLPKPLALNGRAGWDSKLVKACDLDATHKPNIILSMPIQDQAKTNQGIEPEDAMQRLQPTCFSCPTCGAAALSNDKCFQLKDLDNTCMCKACNTRSKVGRWRCNCQLPWHLCTTHIEHCRNQGNKRRTTPPNIAPKKRIASQTFEQLMAHDNLRASKQLCTRMSNSSKCAKPASSILPPQSNILSHNLRERFAYLLNK